MITEETLQLNENIYEDKKNINVNILNMDYSDRDHIDVDSVSHIALSKSGEVYTYIYALMHIVLYSFIHASIYLRIGIIDG